MKGPKPGFKVYLNTRLRHPLKKRDDLVFISEGKKYNDVGSVHTVIIGLMFFVIWMFSLFFLRYTL